MRALTEALIFATLKLKHHGTILTINFHNKLDHERDTRSGYYGNAVRCLCMLRVVYPRIFYCYVDLDSHQLL